MESSAQPQQEATAFANAFNQGPGVIDGFMAGSRQPPGMEQLIGLAPADQATLSASVLQSQDSLGNFQRAPSGYGSAQINGQSQEVRRYLEQLGGQHSGQLTRQASDMSAQGSGHFGQGLSGLGSFGQFISEGSGPLSSLGQASSGLGSFGQPLPQASGHIGHMQNHIGQPRYSPARHSFSSADSLGRLSDVQQQQQLAHMEDAINSGGWGGAPMNEGGDPQPGGGYQGNNAGGPPAERGSAASLLHPEEGARAGEEHYVGSGSSTPSRGPPTPGKCSL